MIRLLKEDLSLAAPLCFAAPYSQVSRLVDLSRILKVIFNFKLIFFNRSCAISTYRGVISLKLLCIGAKVIAFMYFKTRF